MVAIGADWSRCHLSRPCRFPLDCARTVRTVMGMNKTTCRGGCGVRTAASWGICRACKSKRFHARKDVEEGIVVVDEIAGGWWIWSKFGEVLVMDKPSRDAAVRAYINGERAEEAAWADLSRRDPSCCSDS